MAWEDYENRWKSLNATMTALAERYASAHYPRRTTLIALVKGLQAFAQDQFYFFYNSYNSFQACGQVHPLLNPPPPEDAQYHPEFVLGVILDQVSFDMEVIQRAADQRSRRGKMRDILGQADQYAWSLLERGNNEPKDPGGG